MIRFYGNVFLSFNLFGSLDKKENAVSLLKQGMLEHRECPWGRWNACHVELTPCELRLYNLDSSENRQLCTALSLSHCQSIGVPQSQDNRVLQAVFFNSTRLQLRASSQWEVLEWHRLIWEHVLAVRPSYCLTSTASLNAQILDPKVDFVPTSRPLVRPKALPLFTQYCADLLKSGLLYQLRDLNNWSAFTFVLSQTQLQAFQTEGRGPVCEPVMCYSLSSCLAVHWDEMVCTPCAHFQAIFPDVVLNLRAESASLTQDWVEVLRMAVAAQRPRKVISWLPAHGLQMRNIFTEDHWQIETQRAKRQSVTTSFLSILTCLAVEKGLTAQSFRCAGKHHILL